MSETPRQNPHGPRKYGMPSYRITLQGCDFLGGTGEGAPDFTTSLSIGEKRNTRAPPPWSGP